MEKVNYYPFGYTLTVFQAAIVHDTEARNLLEKIKSFSLLIRAGKGQIVKTKHDLNETRSNIAHLQFLKAYNLDMPVSNPIAFAKALRVSEKQSLEEIHMHQKDLKKIYAIHNKTVEEFKSVVDKFARTCAIRHTRQTQTNDAGDNKEEETLTTLNLSRIGVLTLIKKLSDEIKAKPTCNQFTITINTGVTK